MEFENLSVFIEHYKNDALAVDLQKFSSPAYNLYKERELQLNDAEFISEVEDIKQISEDCIRVFKAQLQRDLQHNLKGYVNGIYIFLPNMKLYLLYKDLYTEASQKLTIMQHKTALEPEYTIIDFLQFDLNLALGIIDKQIKLDDYRYYIISSNRELFDSITLGKYLQNLNNPNPYIKAILKEFLEKSKQIIDLDREVMPLIEKRAKEKDIYHHIDFKEHGFIDLAFNYECIKINNINKSSINLSTPENREYFIKNNNYKIFEINQIACKCAIIYNRLTLFFGLKTEEELNTFIKNGTTFTYNTSDKKDATSQNWFKIGLLFANGEMEKLLKEYSQNATKIAQHLGNKNGYRPYISESIGINKQTAQKSIFSNKSKMEAIIKHCNENNIPVISSFTNSLPTE